MVRLLVAGAVAAVALVWLAWPAGDDYLLVVVWETHSQGLVGDEPAGTGISYDPEGRKLYAGSTGGVWLRRSEGLLLVRVDYLDLTVEQHLVALERRPARLKTACESGVVSALPGPVTVMLAEEDGVKGLVGEISFSLRPGEWWSVAAALTPDGIELVEAGDEAGVVLSRWRNAGHPVSVIRVMNMGRWPRSGIVSTKGGMGRCCGGCCQLC